MWRLRRLQVGLGCVLGYPQAESPDLRSSDVWQSIFLAAPTPQALVEPHVTEPRIARANEAFLATLALGRAAVDGRPVATVFRATAGRQVRLAVETCFRTREGCRVRIAHAPADQLVRLSVEVRPLNAGDQPLALVTLAPLTEKLSLAELGEAGVLAEIGPLSRGLVYIRDVRTGWKRNSRHPLRKRLGMPYEGVTATPYSEWVHPEDQSEFERYLGALDSASDADVVRATVRMRDVEGEWLWINLRARVFARDAEGKVSRIIGVATDVTESFTHAEALNQAAAALAHAELNERRRIGRELHDSTAQLLVAARLGLGRLQRELAPPGAARQAIDELRSVIAAAQREIRNFTYVLHPPGLRDQGLETTLRLFANGFAHRTGLEVTVSARKGGARLPFTVEVALFRVAQEALMNVYRHAGATRASVRLARRREQVILEVEDDGVGLSPERLTDPPTGVGVEGMRARMLQLGGRFELAAGAKGLLVRAIAPQDLRPKV